MVRGPLGVQIDTGGGGGGGNALTSALAGTSLDLGNIAKKANTAWELDETDAAAWEERTGHTPQPANAGGGSNAAAANAAALLLGGGKKAGGVAGAFAASSPAIAKLLGGAKNPANIAAKFLKKLDDKRGDKELENIEKASDSELDQILMDRYKARAKEETSASESATSGTEERKTPNSPKKGTSGPKIGGLSDISDDNPRNWNESRRAEERRKLKKVVLAENKLKQQKRLQSQLDQISDGGAAKRGRIFSLCKELWLTLDRYGEGLFRVGSEIVFDRSTRNALLEMTERDIVAQEGEDAVDASNATPHGSMSTRRGAGTAAGSPAPTRRGSLSTRNNKGLELDSIISRKTNRVVQAFSAEANFLESQEALQRELEDMKNDMMERIDALELDLSTARQ